MAMAMPMASPLVCKVARKGDAGAGAPPLLLVLHGSGDDEHGLADVVSEHIAAGELAHMAVVTLRAPPGCQLRPH